MTALAPLNSTGHAAVDAATSRYTTKSYDTSRKISDEDAAAIRKLLRFSPSSTNIQPWHFILASTEDGKARVAKGAEGDYSFNAPKITEASHVVVFASRTELPEEYRKHVTDVEEADGRYASDPETLREQTHGVRDMFINLNDDAGNLENWCALQTYLNIGQFMLGVASMGIDTTPMEGIDTAALDKEFGFAENGLKALAVVSLGYRAKDDFNAQIAKSRLPEDEIITQI